MLQDTANELHVEAEQVSRLLDSLWPANVPRCRHRHATMVQATNKNGDWFVTWQCDDCGVPLADAEGGGYRHRPVSADDLERGDQLPWFDKALLSRHLKALEQRATATAAFFGGKT